MMLKVVRPYLCLRDVPSGASSGCRGSAGVCTWLSIDGKVFNALAEHVASRSGDDCELFCVWHVWIRASEAALQMYLALQKYGCVTACTMYPISHSPSESWMLSSLIHYRTYQCAENVQPCHAKLCQAGNFPHPVHNVSADKPVWSDIFPGTLPKSNLLNAMTAKLELNSTGMFYFVSSSVSTTNSEKGSAKHVQKQFWQST